MDNFFKFHVVKQHCLFIDILTENSGNLNFLRSHYFRSFYKKH